MPDQKYITLTFAVLVYLVVFTYARTIAAQLRKPNVPSPRKGGGGSSGHCNGDGCVLVEVHEDDLSCVVSTQRGHHCVPPGHGHRVRSA